MKKIVSLIFLIIFFVFGVYFAYATSGACSDHGGVSCSAGADFDGSVVCNDGWRDSSVSYSATSECTSNSVCGEYDQANYDKVTGAINNMINYSVNSNKEFCSDTLEQDTDNTEETYKNCQSKVETLRRENIGNGGAQYSPSNSTTIDYYGSQCTEQWKQNSTADQVNYNSCISANEAKLLEYKLELACVSLKPIQPSATPVPEPIVELIPTPITPPEPVESVKNTEPIKIIPKAIIVKRTSKIISITPPAISTQPLIQSKTIIEIPKPTSLPVKKNFWQTIWSKIKFW